jgi:hypothetical protein
MQASKKTEEMTSPLFCSVKIEVLTSKGVNTKGVNLS